MAAGQAEGVSRSWSDGQPGATFGAARTQDLAAADGFHPGAEPVGPLAPDHRGLVSAFHGCALLKKKLCIRAFSAPSCQGKSRRDACRVYASRLWITRHECAY